jgi:hypothetical protein
MDTIGGVVPTALMLGGIGLAGGVIYLWLYLMEWSGKRPPFTKAFLRTPGESLRRQVDDMTLDLMAYMMMAAALPVLIFSVLAGQAWFGKAPTFATIAISIMIGVISEGYVLYRLFGLLRTRNILRLGWEGEVAVGEELNQLMLQSFRVFHDVPAEGFNIDHVVIGPRGVLAVETKTRSKRLPRQGTEAVKVQFDGKALLFPGYTDSSPLDQAKRQANWLAKWLASATGEPIAVFPVIVLPGWYVDRKATSKNLFVIGSGEIRKAFRQLGNGRLSAEQIQRVSHQIDQRCRTVEAWRPNVGTNRTMFPERAPRASP